MKKSQSLSSIIISNLVMIALVISIVLLWQGAGYLWKFAWGIFLIILGVVSLLAAVLSFVGCVFDDSLSTSTRFLIGLVAAGLLILSGFLWFSVVSYFTGIDTLALIPHYFSGMNALAVSIPWTIWLGTIVSTVILTLIFKFGISLMSESVWSSGSELDTLHQWTDYRGIGWGRATRQEVYDYYHGRGSWYSMIGFGIFMGKLAAVFLPVLIPLAVIQLIGWHDFFHADGILLSVVLVIISTTLTFFRWR